MLADYEASADVFLAIVALPSVIGEMSFAVWLLLVATGRRPSPTEPATSGPPAAQPTQVDSTR